MAVLRQILRRADIATDTNFRGRQRGCVSGPLSRYAYSFLGTKEPSSFDTKLSPEKVSTTLTSLMMNNSRCRASLESNDM